MAEQVLSLGENVFERWPPVVVGGLGEAPAVELVAVGLEVLAPVDLLEVLGVVRLGLGSFLCRLGLAEHSVDARLGGIEVDNRFVRLPLLEHRVFLELGLDQRFQLRTRHLQDLDRLAQLGCHHQLLGELLEELRLERHRPTLYRGTRTAYSRNFSPR